MHGNTFKTSNGIKTRKFDDILMEVIDFFVIHKKMGSYPGGIHLELTPDSVTECIGGEIETINEQDLNKLYKSQCDPRLNGMQALELIFLVSELINKF
jgi:3-deoxy-7-phosphoheptulonate synthase